MTSEIVRVFIPSTTLECSSCWLLGWKSADKRVQCVTHYMELTDDDIVPTNGDVDGIPVLGVLENVLFGAELSKRHKKFVSQLPDSIRVTKSNSELPEFTVRAFNNRIDPATEVVVIIFDAEDLNASQMLEVADKTSNLGLLYRGWQTCGTKQNQPRGTDSKTSIPKRFCDGSEGFPNRILDSGYFLMMQIFIVISNVILCVCDMSFFDAKVLSFIPKPASLIHLVSRSREIHTVRKVCDGNCPKLQKLRVCNLLYKLTFDLALGLAVMYLLLSGDHTKVVAEKLMTWAQTMASELHSLIQWMMGVPAGLKLNHELANFLGQFFLYHIYLWTGYLSFLTPLWKDAVWYIAVSGCLGLSFQLSLVQDLLSMMMLHSYCFYVYAARLYYLQMYGLLSLWRLFRGKKWNPLFERVDTSTYDVDRLIIGTPLFTILLFLLPTTGLFYLVFTGLRLVVLTLQGLIYKCVHFLNSLPLYLLLARVFNPRVIAGDVRLHVLPRLPSRPLYHVIQLLPVDFSELLNHVNAVGLPSASPSYTWSMLINKAVSGQLIYPWIEASPTGR